MGDTPVSQPLASHGGCVCACACVRDFITGPCTPVCSTASSSTVQALHLRCRIFSMLLNSRVADYHFADVKGARLECLP